MANTKPRTYRKHVSTVVRDEIYDRLAREALASETSVSAVARRRLSESFRDPHPKPSTETVSQEARAVSQ